MRCVGAGRDSVGFAPLGGPRPVSDLDGRGPLVVLYAGQKKARFPILDERTALASARPAKCSRAGGTPVLDRCRALVAGLRRQAALLLNLKTGMRLLG